ncbi:hypothetical protein CHLRE_09g390393v5 [Chlamydomonas reinhardtii]|uniref:Smr domain-containing protein n=1 Tax=Chlamydomonas reinhardtii TaxID=3055 RepID=A0A2K3DE39_CHLRE|nr:uncharacterized protein CHLRE_09g390393v5 [Chlamydomonas reinhardtii]XP_042921135.1 uncharacterized protein CHLRE_09g390393v5 [Chlamydomonas reinhardtii]PNW78793.1 hypothetical protein CHLRE_09g390393v5 [Chlamydomonas reinhardtii]PNW78794.1 hypothetical protein CHLRE_09g390393v5 [Chlamydomonas reinhardtii]
MDTSRAEEYRALANAARARGDWQAATQYNERAAELFYNAYNAHRGNDELDLHGLFVKEALVHVERRVRNLSSGMTTLRIIVGRGNRSADGPRLKPAVEAWLRQRGYDFKEDGRNNGCLVVQVQGSRAARVEAVWQQAQQYRYTPAYWEQPPPDPPSNGGLLCVAIVVALVALAAWVFG